jgi:transmembrane sensor
MPFYRQSVASMNYDLYTPDDFLLDDSFLAYCRGNDPQAAVRWTQWLQQTPPNLAAFRQAEASYALLSANKPPIDAAFEELRAILSGER